MASQGTSLVGAVETQQFSFGSPSDPFELELGGELKKVDVAYETYGTLNEKRDNAILIFHALSGSMHAAGINKNVQVEGAEWTEECHLGWWDGFIGPGKAIDTNQFYVICANYLGGCYGTTGPASINPDSGKPYGSAFPRVRVADVVRTQARLLDHLGIDRLHAVVGGSLGGMMTVSFATLYPERVHVVIPIASSLVVSILQRILNFEQIFAIENDRNFNGGDYYDGEKPLHGLSLARIVAHKTYVSLNALTRRARREIIQPEDGFSHYKFTHTVESYMEHHGRKFMQRFDANSYLRICEAWQNFDLFRASGKSSFTELFESCKHQEYMVFSIDCDVCFYPDEQLEMVRQLKQAGVSCRHITVHSEKGHDSFLLDADLFTPHLSYTLENKW